MKAKLAGEFVMAMSERAFPGKAKEMSTMTVDWLTSLGLDVQYGSHKYIPQERLNELLALPQGAGVYGFYRFDDSSYLLLTCDDGIAYWDGSIAGVIGFVPEVRHANP